jgi:hypothetical protein
VGLFGSNPLSRSDFGSIFDVGVLFRFEIDVGDLFLFAMGVGVRFGIVFRFDLSGILYITAINNNNYPYYLSV